MRPIPILGLALVFTLASGAQAAIVVGNAYLNFDRRADNSLRQGGTFLRMGAVSVTDSATGNALGITGVGMTMAPDGQVFSTAIPYMPGPRIPNTFQRLMPLDAVAVPAAAYQPWSLSFSKGADSTTRTLQLGSQAGFIPFVDGIRLSGTALAPTFTWNPPPNTVVQGYRINIYDKSLITSTNNGEVASRDIFTTQHTITAADFNMAEHGFQAGKNYMVEIAALQTKDASTNTSNSNLQSVSRIYADFTPVEGRQEIYLPVLRADGAYAFNIPVQAGQTYYIDPEVAIGYDYAIGAGDPNFRAVLLPDGVGDGRYDIWGWDGADWALLAHDWLSGELYDFGLLGVDRFRVTGIETEAGLDPADTTAFVTGLQFVAAGQFTGTQTPITVDVPEPSMGGLLAAGLAGLALWRRRGPPARRLRACRGAWAVAGATHAPGLGMGRGAGEARSAE